MQLEIALPVEHYRRFYSFTLSEYMKDGLDNSGVADFLADKDILSIRNHFLVREIKLKE